MDLSQDGALGWAWVVLASLALCASLTLTPALAPERMGGLCTLGAFTLALELLLGVCCLYTGGDWFWITAVSVVFAAALLLLPFVLRRLPLPGKWGRHRAALWLGIVSLLLMVLLGAAALYSGGGWFFRLGLHAALGCLLLPWALLLALRYLPARPCLRASAAFAAAAVWFWLFPWALDRLMRLNGWQSDQLYRPLDFYGVNFANWPGTPPASKTMFLILSALTLTSAALAVADLVTHRRK